MARKENASEMLAALVVAGAGNSEDPEVKELWKYFLSEQVRKIRQEKTTREAHAKAARDLAAEIIQKRANVRRTCSHRKPYPSHATRLAGQALGNGQIMLVCQRCGSDYYWPPKKGSNQVAPPPELFPKAEFIGGPQAYAHNILG